MTGADVVVVSVAIAVGTLLLVAAVVLIVAGLAGLIGRR